MTSKLQLSRYNTKANYKAQRGGEGRAGLLNMILQVSLGIIVGYLVYLFFIWILIRDQIKIQNVVNLRKRDKTVVFEGFLDASVKPISFNTVVPIAGNYKKISPSMNIKGGTQFTYTFWLNIDPTATDANLRKKVLFLKGSQVPFNFNVYDTKEEVTYEVRNDFLVYCPMIRFGESSGSLDVCFNTLSDYNSKLSIENRQSSDSTLRNNLLGVIRGTWTLITITFEDNIPINEFENGTVVKVFINDGLYKIGRYPSALKQNYGDLVLFPNDQGIQGVKISDLRYYNYVISTNDVAENLAKGPTLKPSDLYLKPYSSAPNVGPPTLSDYNTLDLYN